VTDASLRILERRARETGDVADRAALLQARLRAGLLTMEQVRCAAYAGDLAARAVDDARWSAETWATVDGQPFFPWLRGTTDRAILVARAFAARRNKHRRTYTITYSIEVRIVVAVARAAVAHFVADPGYDLSSVARTHEIIATAQTAIAAASAWLANPSNKTHGAWYEAAASTIHPPVPNLEALRARGIWLPYPTYGRQSELAPRERIQSAINVAGETAVRAYIAKDISRWALGEETPTHGTTG
jgi:hypothetical protein